jgi:capsular exopolysaccharide synthesis family protein
LEMAAHTVTVSIVNETRLIELGCESPNPVITAAYLNNVAAAFIEGAKRERAEAADTTHDWLTHHLEETKTKLENSDAHLRAFVLQSGNVFASSESTVEDVKLRDLQNQLSAAQIDELAKRSAYESAVRNGDYENLPAVINDPIAAELRSQIAELQRQKGALLLNLTDKNPKVIAIEDQRQYLEAALKREAQHIIGRLHEEYQASLNRENLLLKAYAEESGRVSAQASKASQYSNLRRETDDLQKQYDSLLTELSKTQVAQSAPVFPLRLVQPSQAPLLPSQPQPATLLILGILGGVAATLVTAFIREKADRGIGSPETLRTLVRVPQLGVIPAADELSKLPGAGVRSVLKNIAKPQLLAAASESTASGVDSASVARAAWEEGSDLLADSFRSTVTSINRFFRSSADTPAILITSATAGAGKTTVLSNLGIALSESGRRVVLVDGDFRRPRLSRIFGTGLGVALPDVLNFNKPVHEYSLDQLTVPTKFPRLSLLPSYTPEQGVATLVYSRRLPEILERLRHAFDIVLIDAPPALFPADARVLAEFCHAAILVVRAGHCERDTVRAAARSLHQDNVPILGTVLNGWVPMGPKSGMRYYSDYLTPKQVG